jgi:hypothetical protein
MNKNIKRFIYALNLYRYKIVFYGIMYRHHHMALQPNSGPGLPLWGFVTTTSLRGWIVSPTPNPQPGGPGLRIYDPRRQGGPAIPPGTGSPLLHAWVTVGLFIMSYRLIDIRWHPCPWHGDKLPGSIKCLEFLDRPIHYWLLKNREPWRFADGTASLYEDVCLIGCCPVYPGGSKQAFHRCFLLPLAAYSLSWWWRQ